MAQERNFDMSVKFVLRPSWQRASSQTPTMYRADRLLARPPGDGFDPKSMPTSAPNLTV